MIKNRIPITIGNAREIIGPRISFQHDVKQYLIFKAADILPDYFDVDFCNEGDASTKPISGSREGGVRIPDEYLKTGKKVNAYIMITGDDEGAVETRIKITLPVDRRPARTDIAPTDEERLEIDTLMDDMNDAVDQAEDAAERAEEAASLLKNPSAEAETLEPDESATASYDDGTFYFGIPRGHKGDPFTYEDFTEEQKEELVQGPIKEAQDAAVLLVNTTGTTNVGAVNQAGSTNVSAVNQAGATQVNAVNQAGQTQVSNVNTAGATQVQAVEDKGEEVLESIPQDYTDLSNDVDLLNQEIDDKAPVIVDTASGAIASFHDGADNMPVKSLVCRINPQQDLHGYDNPWPAGGGKNKFQNIATTQTINGVTFTVRNDGTVSTSGTATGGSAILRLGTVTLPIGDYIASGLSETGRTTTFRLVVTNEAFSSGIATVLSVNGAAFSLAEDKTVGYQIVISDGINADGLVFSPMIEVGTTKTDYAPYANECPITGFTGLNLQHRARNLLPIGIVSGITYNKSAGEVFAPQATGSSWTQGTDRISYVTSANYTNCSLITALLPAGDYIVSATKLSAGSLRFTGYALDKSFVVLDNSTASNLSTKERAFSLPNGGYIAFYLDNGNTASQTLELQIQVEPGSTAHGYLPYTGETIPVSWQTEAGIVYGANINLTTGGMTRTYGIVDGSTVTWTKDSSGNRYTFPASFFKHDQGRNFILCNRGVYRSHGSDVGTCFVGSNGRVYYYPPTEINTLALFNTWIEENPLFFVGPLDTPVEYQLDPVTVSTLLGENNIWHDANGDVSVDYCADTKLYLEKLTQPTEDDMIANANIAANKFFMIGNMLYLSTAAIAQGATIVPGTNCNKVSLADALNTLNA